MLCILMFIVYYQPLFYETIRKIHVFYIGVAQIIYMQRSES